MFTESKLIKDIVPEDELKKKAPLYYPKGAKVEITPHGYYVPVGTPLAGWIYKNLKTKQLNTSLVKGIDYDCTN